MHPFAWPVSLFCDASAAVCVAVLLDCAASAAVCAVSFLDCVASAAVSGKGKGHFTGPRAHQGQSDTRHVRRTLATAKAIGAAPKGQANAKLAQRAVFDVPAQS